ncbi:MAG: hypothetical protein AB4426_23850 [Xenococcaceae cyanobacterium]
MDNVTKINFSDHIPETKKAFIRQLFLDATQNTDIDPHHINVSFEDIINQDGQKITQGQIKYFMPSARELSKEFRLQIIKIIEEDIYQKLLDNGIYSEIVDLIWIDSQISI